MRRAFGCLAFGICVFGSPAVFADVMVSSSLSLAPLQITATGYTVQFSGVTASAFTSVFDGLAGPCVATGAIFTGTCIGYDSESGAASASASQGAASASGDADATALTADASSNVNIPGTLIDAAGTNNAGPYGDLSGTFEILSSSSTPSPVTVNFSAPLTGIQTLFMDSYGVSAYSEVIFNLIVSGTFTTGFNVTTELFLDSPLSLSSAGSITNPISTTLSNSDSTLLTNTTYSFDAQVDAESMGANTPEPSFFILTAVGFAALLVTLRRRHRRQEFIG